MATDIAFALVLSLRADSTIRTLLGTTDADALKARVDMELAEGVDLPAIAVSSQDSGGDDGMDFLAVAQLDIKVLASPEARSSVVAIQSRIRAMLHEQTSFDLGSGGSTVKVHHAARHGGAVPLREDQTQAWYAAATYAITYIEA